jgi:hypothetical protein
MRAPSILVLAPLLAIVSSHPTGDVQPELASKAEAGSHLVPRRGDNSGRTYYDAIDTDIECFGSEEPCDADAFAMLCLGAPRTLYEHLPSGHIF